MGGRGYFDRGDAERKYHQSNPERKYCESRPPTSRSSSPSHHFAGSTNRKKPCTGVGTLAVTAGALLPAQPHRLRMEVRRSNYQCSPASSARHHRVEAARRRTQFLPGAVPRDKAGVQFLEDQGGAEASDRGYYSSSLDRYPKQSNDQRPKPEPNQCAKAENRRKNNEHTHFA